MLGHKSSLNTFKKIEIISSIFSEHNGMKLEISNKQKTGKCTNMWMLNNILLKTNEPKKKSKSKSKNILRQMKMESEHTETYGTQQKQF